MSEPQFEILTEDVTDAMRIGQIVQEAEADATVNHHPWCPPGVAIIINRHTVTDLSLPLPFEFRASSDD